MQVKIIKIGSANGVIIPKKLLKKLNLESGDKVSISEVDGQLVIGSAKPKYTLDELIAKCNPNAPLSPELLLWDQSKPVGNEPV